MEACLFLLQKGLFGYQVGFGGLIALLVYTVGAVGFLEKQTAAEILAKAIHEVVKGHRFFSPAIAKRMTNGKHWARDYDGLLRPNGVRLTSSETKVLRLVAEGQVSEQVATTLGISIKAVEKHRKLAMDKLNIHETADLTRYAIAQGIIKSRVKTIPVRAEIRL